MSQPASQSVIQFVGMQKTQKVLYPPLERGDDAGDDSHDQLFMMDHTTSSSGGGGGTHKSTSCAWQASSCSSSFAGSGSVLPAALRANFDTLEHQSPQKRQRCSKANALATETAVLVSQHVQRMQESIAELERLLAVKDEEDAAADGVVRHANANIDVAVDVNANNNMNIPDDNEDNDNNNNNNNVVFPALPSVVVVVHDNDNGNDNNPNHSLQADANADAVVDTASSNSDDDDDEAPCTSDE